MRVFFILSNLISPFLLPLGLFNLSFWILFLRNQVSRKIWVVWGISFWIASIPLTADLFLYLWEEPLGFSEALEPNSYDIIIILGGMVEGISSEGQWMLGGSVDRLTEAFRLYQKGVAPLILVTGGGSGSVSQESKSWTEVEVMEAFLVTMGISQEKILKEDQAYNTYQNAFYSKALLVKAGVKKILLVTSAFHMKRSLAVFKKIGLEVDPFVVDPRKMRMKFPINLFPSQQAFSIVGMIVRELAGYFIYKVMGYL